MSGFSVLKPNGNLRKCNAPMHFIFSHACCTFCLFKAKTCLCFERFIEEGDMQVIFETMTTYFFH